MKIIKRLKVKDTRTIIPFTDTSINLDEKGRKIFLFPLTAAMQGIEVENKQIDKYLSRLLSL